MTMSVGIVFLLFVITSSIWADCEVGWYEFEDNCYSMLPIDLPLGANKQESRLHCLKHGADLVLIKSQEQQSFVMSLLYDADSNTSAHYDIYLGGGDAVTEGEYLWQDGTPVTYSNWRYKVGKPEADQEPNDDPDLPQDCFRIKPGYSKTTFAVIDALKGWWITVPCTTPNGRSDHALCQKSNAPVGENNDNIRKRKMVFVTNTYYAGYEITTHSVTHISQCVIQCNRELRCISLNLNLQDSFDNCILNNASRHEDNNGLLVGMVNGFNAEPWVYYESTWN